MAILLKCGFALYLEAAKSTNRVIYLGFENVKVGIFCRRCGRNLMSIRYLLKGFGIGVAYILYLSICYLITKNDGLLLCVYLFTLLLLFVILRKNLDFGKTSVRVTGSSILMGIGLALSFSIIVPFANDVNAAAVSVDYSIFYYINSMLLLPIIEEVLFRGIVVHDFLRNYPLKFAIVSSAFIWLIVHLNPLNAVVYLIHGMILAYVMFLTSNILYPILIHVTINSFNLLGGTNFVLRNLATISTETISIILTIIASVILIVGSLLLMRKYSS